MAAISFCGVDDPFAQVVVLDYKLLDRGDATGNIASSKFNGR
ncbi:hypothetical protein [Nitrosomonas sp. Nm166]|nr:hypothetical protein [Nitrosomonas sp. Nm166]